MTDENRGRPTGYSQEVGDAICERLITGESLRHICLDDSMPTQSMVYRWLAKDEEEFKVFRVQYAHAREEQSDYYVAEILDIADDSTNDWMEREGKDGSKTLVLNQEHVQRSRLRIDTRKWIASKLKPKKYGDKLGVVPQTPDGEPITGITVNVVQKEP